MWLAAVIILSMVLALNFFLFILAINDRDKSNIAWRGVMTVAWSWLLYVYASDPGIFS